MERMDILLIEDEPDQRRIVASILKHEGCTVSDVESAEEALELLRDHVFDLVISDWKLPQMNGFELLKQVRQMDASVAFIMVTAYGSITHAVHAIRHGADDYLTKPFEREALLLAVDRAYAARSLVDENRRLTEALGERDRLVELIGSAPSMQRLFRTVEKVAGTDATVLITGESGTGKELTARALHALSRRKDSAFVAVNCAAIPEGLIESEFFGAERGAYTGSEKSRPGKFEAAHGGTLFLDEIGELPIAIQPKLLRVVQDGRLCRVGSNEERQVDVRLIAATNRDLKADVAAGRFREDLFYRLNVLSISLPPLRDRREDIPQLVHFFARKASRRHRTKVEKIPSAVMRQLVDYSWPGNVRELANTVERLVLLSDDGRISREDLPDSLRENTAPEHTFQLPAAGMDWEHHERSCLEQALELAAGNRARAARLLNLPYKAFLYRLEKHQLSP
ncbi:MAG: sigma-54-dependent Fis family transcriptional regulator [Acidobacteria bacterium]|nr:sigma-54-dependent Fis family transcriptional regulator [Acidobacteriota bacterium]